MESFTIHQASLEDIPTIADIAQRTWPICYKDMISRAAIDYMLELFYQHDALAQQMTAMQHQFIIASIANQAVGFASYQLNYDAAGDTKLHKLYVLPDLHTKGIGRGLLQEVIHQAKVQEQSAIHLHVNRGNTAIGFYKQLGFEILRSEDIDIGGGFWMNDYLMTKSIQ